MQARKGIPEANPRVSVLTKAMRQIGFKGEFHGVVRVGLSTPVLHFPPDGRAEEKYREAVESVPGVLSDEGQGSGYEFEVDIEDFTPASEAKLLMVLGRYRRYALASSSPAGEGTRKAGQP